MRPHTGFDPGVDLDYDGAAASYCDLFIRDIDLLVSPDLIDCANGDDFDSDNQTGYFYLQRFLSNPLSEMKPMSRRFNLSRAPMLDELVLVYDIETGHLETYRDAVYRWCDFGTSYRQGNDASSDSPAAFSFEPLMFASTTPLVHVAHRNITHVWERSPGLQPP